MIQRKQYQLLISRLQEPRKCIQVIQGPRQVGKSTMVKQVLKDISMPWLHFSTDNVPTSGNTFISDCWQIARTKMQTEHLSELLLVIDEVQRLSRWSDAVKKEWDEDTFNDVNIKVVLLGSSRVMLERGLADSLMGRFETIRMGNWTLQEMQDAFGMTLEQYIYYGGYPGAYAYINDVDRWREYVRGAIIDATINNDVLMDTPVSKPALLRQTFELSAAYSGQQLSLTKMLGQLQDAGNTTTLANYLDLLNQSGMVCGLQKFAMNQVRRRASIPKYQVYNNALMSYYNDETFEQALSLPKVWGRLYESAIGTYILNEAYLHNIHVYYWREGNDEVDFVLMRNGKVVAIEVKSNGEMDTKGLHRFADEFHPYQSIIVGPKGIPAEVFLKLDLRELFK